MQLEQSTAESWLKAVVVSARDVPAAHAVQVVVEALLNAVFVTVVYLPALQMVQLPAPAAEYVPVPQAVQTVFIPDATYVPAAQLPQAAAVSEAMNVPAPQFVHVEAALPAPEYVPAAQRLHRYRVAMQKTSVAPDLVKV